VFTSEVGVGVDVDTTVIIDGKALGRADTVDR
jgi:hypothetical protein